MIKSLGIEIEMAVYQKSEPITCWFMPYTKDDPCSINGHLLHKDASMFELAIAPASEPSELDSNVFDAFKYADTMLPDGAVMRPVPAVEYTDEALSLDPYASILGCGASQNIYGTPSIGDKYEDNYRYGGIHVNLEFHDKGTCPIETAFRLDYMLGLNSVINWEDGYRDEMQRRRKYYGRAGEYRVKPFGMEYRTLPNCAVVSGMALWRNIETALSLPIDKLIKRGDDIQEAINTSDRYMAEGIIGDIGVLYQ